MEIIGLLFGVRVRLLRTAFRINSTLVRPITLQYEDRIT